MLCQTGSSAFAITASSAIATGRKSWPDAANCWACRPRRSHRNRPRITETGTKNLPGPRCASVRSATAAACSRLRHSPHTDHRRSKIPHEQHGQLRNITISASSGLPTPQQSCVSRCAGGHAFDSIPFGLPFSTPRNSRSHLRNRAATLFRGALWLRSGLCQPFNAHRGRASCSGLVQSIFSPPARPRRFFSFLSLLRPRRRAKNALHYLPFRIMSRTCSTA